MTPPPLRPAIYVRVSSKSQADEGWSLEAQERACREYCAALGWAVPVVYADAGRSAFADAAAKRPAWRQLLADAEARAFDVVVVHKLDRWARNVGVNIASLDVLKRHGVGFVSVSERMDTTGPFGEAMMLIVAVFAQLYSTNLGAEVRKGQQARQAAGFPHPRYPYGSRLVGQRLEVDPLKAAHLARILELSSGMGDRMAADTLNKEGVPPRSSDHWEGTTVRSVLRAASWLVKQPAPWPARYAAAINRRPPPPVRADRTIRLLTGLLRCGLCGCRMTHGSVAARNYNAAVVCWRPGHNRAGCVPGAPRKTHSLHYERRVLAWVAALPSPGELVRAAERLAAREDPALAELATIRAQRERIKAQHDAGLIDDDRMAAEAALLVARARTILPLQPDMLRHTVELAIVLPDFAALPSATANTILREMVEAVVIRGRECEVVPHQWLLAVINEAERYAEAA